MKYKVIVSDFDGTIFSHKLREIPENVRSAIDDYRKKGGIFVLCTGRMYTAIKRYATSLGLSGELLCLQGSVCCKLETDEELFVFDISKETTLKVAEYAESLGWTYHFYHDLRVFTESTNKYTTLYEDMTGITATYTGDKVSKTIAENSYTAHKFIIMTEPDEAKRKMELLRDNFPDLDISQSTPIFIELVDKNSGKGNAVKRLSEYLNIPIGDIAVMGDETNDLPMLKVAGIALAPENAVAEVKAVADVIYPSVHEGGASVVIRKIIEDLL